MFRVSRTGRLNTLLAKGDRWIPAAFFVCVLALYLTFLSGFVFLDELDVFYGGYNIVKSGDLYRFYPSQHMPFTYYISALGALLGARESWQFRVYFYVLLSGLWTGIYLRNRKVFSRPALILMPVLYIVQLWMHSLAQTMLSDHWQGIGLLMILLEMLRYTEEKKISAGMACMISLGIVLSFGTTFLSAYSLLIIFLGVVAMQAVQAVRKERTLPELLKEDGRLTLICLCPFLILAAWYAASGNLGLAAGSAYDLNVNIYSKYLGGFGTNPGGTFFGTFTNWISYQQKGASYLNAADWRWALQVFLQTASLAVLVISLLKDRKIIAAIVFPAAVILTGVRAFDGFHGMPYMAVTCIPMAFCLDGGLAFFLERRNWKRAVPAAAALACFLALAVPLMPKGKELLKLPLYTRQPEYPDSNRYVLEILAEPGERIHTDDISESGNTIMRNNLRLEEGSLGASNPWFYEYYGERALEVLKEKQTRIVLYEPDGQIWGYVARDYAPDLTAYIEEHYTSIGMNIYIRNEDYPAAVEKLRQQGYGIRVSDPDYDGDYIIGPRLTPGAVFEQRFVATERLLTAAHLMIGTYLGQNEAGVTVELADAESGEILAESTLARQELRDNFHTRFAMRAETEPGKTYALRIRLDGEVPEGKESLVNLYISEDREEAAGYIDGEKQAFDWAYRIEYDPGD